MLSTSTNKASLDTLYEQGRLWRGRASTLDEQRLATGHEALDQALGGGLAKGCLTEILSHRGLGLSLLLPLLARLSKQARWLAWLDPPYPPYAPALAQAGIAVGHVLLIQARKPGQDLWALEQSLGSGHCAAVLAWPRRITSAQLRRLQLSAERGDALGLLFRPPQALSQSSPAGFRIAVSACSQGLKVRVHKRRGGWGRADEIPLPWSTESELWPGAAPFGSRRDAATQRKAEGSKRSGYLGN